MNPEFIHAKNRKHKHQTRHRIIFVWIENYTDPGPWAIFCRCIFICDGNLVPRCGETLYIISTPIGRDWKREMATIWNRNEAKQKRVPPEWIICINKNRKPKLCGIYYTYLCAFIHHTNFIIVLYNLKCIFYVICSVCVLCRTVNATACYLLVVGR